MQEFDEHWVGRGAGSLARDLTVLQADGPAVAQPRAIGRVRVAARLRNGQSRLADLHQSGSSKALFPRGEGPGVTAVLLNTAGGVTGGDRFETAAEATQGASLTLSTQAAERAYRAQPGETGHIATRLTAAPGATLHWLPQETILFDGARLVRRLDAELAADARLLAVEPMIFGRAAMGERLDSLHFHDSWRIRRDGRLVYADALRLDGAAAAILARPGTLAGAGAMASLLYTAPDAEARLAPLRALLPATAGASLIRPGVLAARLAAPDGFTLRRALIPVLETLRGAPLPRVWML